MSLIDATPVKSHLIALLDAGMTYAEIAEAAGVTDSMVRYLRDRRTVQSAKAAQILAVPVPVRGPIDPARADRASRIVKSDGRRHSESVRILTTEERLGDWRDRAACRGVHTEVFFPRTTDPEAASHALAFCARCPVVEACRTFGIESRQEYGVWGGTTPEDRAQSREMAPVTGPRRTGTVRCTRCDLDVAPERVTDGTCDVCRSGHVTRFPLARRSGK